MSFMSEQYSPEEKNLYNPAYVGTLLYQTIREYHKQNSSGFHCGLTYIAAPLSISPKYSKILPTTVGMSIASWVAQHEGELIGFAEVISAYVDIVNSSIAFLLERDLIVLNENGRYFLTNTTLPQKSDYITRNSRFKDSYVAAGLLGRWFSSASTVESVYAQLGLRP